MCCFVWLLFCVCVCVDTFFAAIVLAIVLVMLE